MIKNNDGPVVEVSDEVDGKPEKAATSATDMVMSIGVGARNNWILRR